MKLEPGWCWAVCAVASEAVTDVSQAGHHGCVCPSIDEPFLLQGTAIWMNWQQPKPVFWNYVVIQTTFFAALSPVVKLPLFSLWGSRSHNLPIRNRNSVCEWKSEACILLCPCRCSSWKQAAARCLIGGSFQSRKEKEESLKISLSDCLN